MVDESRRQAYLQAMGVTVWEVRAPEAFAHLAPDLEEALPESIEAPEVSIEETAVAEPASAPAPEMPQDIVYDEPAFWDEPAESSDAADDWAAYAAAPTGADGVPMLDSSPAEEATANAVSLMDWDALAEAVADCRACGLCETRTQTVFGVGDQGADLMIVGEAPGADEDRAGEPFVGRAGQLLNRMLAAIGLRREQVYIANVLKCRPPGNRDPKAEEAMQCEAFLMRQIALVRPKVILSVGRISAQHLLRTETSVGRLRGRWLDLGEQRIPLRVTYHPAYLLRSPDQKAKAWDDLTAVRQRLDA